MAINAFLMIPEIGVFNDYTYVIELVMWIVSLVGLWLMKKWGAALTIAILCISLGTSMSTVFVAHYLSALLHPIALVNALRVPLNTIGIVYMFKSVFAKEFEALEVSLSSKI
jgi:hypothetical protein